MSPSGKELPEFIRGWTAPFHVTMDGIKDANGCWICSATNHKLATQIVELMNYAALSVPTPGTGGAPSDWVAAESYLRDNPLRPDAPRYTGNSDLADEIANKIEALLSEERQGAFIGLHQVRAIQEIKARILSALSSSPVGEMVTPGAEEAFAALDVADRLIERGYGDGAPKEWNKAYRAVAKARAASPQGVR